MGVAHYDTDDPHVHLLVRGKDASGADLVISRDYMSHGMRLQGMEVATRRLGPRLAEELQHSLKRDLTADRLTPADLAIAQQADLHPDGLITALRRRDGTPAAEALRLNTLTRLQHLESLGLARELRPGLWQPAVDLEDRLRRLVRRGDIIKRLHEGLQGRSAGALDVLLGEDPAPRRAITGRVYGTGAVDELSDRRYLLVEGLDAKSYFVPMGEADGTDPSLRIGSLVRLNPPGDSAVRGLPVSVERLSLIDLDAQTTAAGLTWLDRQLADPSLADAVNPSSLRRSVSDALQARARHLQSLGLTDDMEGTLRPRPGFLNALYERELSDAARRLQGRYGEMVRLDEATTFKGSVAAIEELPSGAHAVVESRSRFALVPVRAGQTLKLGRSLGISLSRSSLPDSSNLALQPGLQIRMLDLSRTPRLRR
jgi:hypothetical protein